MISVTAGIDKAAKQLRNLEKQVRFATQKAVNKTATDVQSGSLALLPNKITLRAKGAPWQKPGNRFGFNVRFANKETLTATVGSQADWVKLAEEGGTKSRSGSRIAIPTKYWKQRNEIMAANKKPRAIIAKDYKAKIAQTQRNISSLSSQLGGKKTGLTRAEKQQRHDAKIALRKERASLRKQQFGLLAITSMEQQPFIAKLKSGKEGIFVRTGAGRVPIKPLFLFMDSVGVKERMFFVRDGQLIVNKRYRANFDAELTKAILTAK